MTALRLTWLRFMALARINTCGRNHGTGDVLKQDAERKKERFVHCGRAKVTDATVKSSAYFRDMKSTR